MFRTHTHTHRRSLHRGTVTERNSTPRWPGSHSSQWGSEPPDRLSWESGMPGGCSGELLLEPRTVGQRASHTTLHSSQPG